MSHVTSPKFTGFLADGHTSQGVHPARMTSHERLMILAPVILEENTTYKPQNSLYLPEFCVISTFRMHWKVFFVEGSSWGANFFGPLRGGHTSHVIHPVSPNERMSHTSQGHPVRSEKYSTPESIPLSSLIYWGFHLPS